MGKRRGFLLSSLYFFLRNGPQYLPADAADRGAYPDNTRGNTRRPGILGNVGLSQGIPKSGALSVGLDDSTVFLPFFTMALELAVFPLAASYPCVDASGIKSKLDSWQRAAQPVRDYLQDPGRKHAGHIDEISVAFARFLLRNGRYRHPPYLALPIPVDIFD